MKIKNQRLRNLTTGRLHTEMSDIYKDIEKITGFEGVMTHQLPSANKALKPYLMEHIKDERFWDDKYDVDHTGKTKFPKMNDQEHADFMVRYEEETKKMWSK